MLCCLCSVAVVLDRLHFRRCQKRLALRANRRALRHPGKANFWREEVTQLVKDKVMRTIPGLSAFAAFCILLLVSSPSPTAAQASNPSTASTQAQSLPPGTIPTRILQAIDEKNLIVLPRNVHPLARAEYDRGVAPPDLPLER